MRIFNGHQHRGIHHLPVFFRSPFSAAQLIAVSITILGYGLGCVTPGQAEVLANPTNNLQNVSSGTYLNTPGTKTTFTPPNGGLWLHGNPATSNSTCNNGSVHFQAPGNTVRIDGAIDVNAVNNGALFTGNNGRVAVASAMASNAALATPPINTVNDGRIVAGGTYLNTANSKTTFINSQNGGLWVRSGTVVQGLESNSTGATTGNGGTIQFYAPDNVVRIDGTVNVNALLNNTGAFAGDGGKVFVDAAYLINNGNIFASGINGGLVQVNVAGMTMNPTGRIFAHGYGGNGGVVSVNSSGTVDIRRGSVIDSAGRVSGTLDTNVINLEGSLVNVDGVLRADGIANQGIGSRGGTIRLVATGRTDIVELQNAFTKAGGTNPGDPTSSATLTGADQNALLTRSRTLATSQEGNVTVGYRTVNGTTPTGGWVSANGSNGPAADNNDLTENNTSRAGDGGSIIMAAERNVHIFGMVSANGGAGANGASTGGTPAQPNLGVAGGDGGTISMNANQDVAILNTAGQLSGVVQAMGGMGGQTRAFSLDSAFANPSARGGNGGLIAFSATNNQGNRGTVSVRGGNGGTGTQVPNDSDILGLGGDGGNGGLIVFSANANPIGGGTLNDKGGDAGATGLNFNNRGGAAGLIVAPNPATLRNTQVVIQQDGNSSLGAGSAQPTIGQTAGDELLTHAENLIWLRRNITPNTHARNIAGILVDHQGTVRSVSDLNGQGAALNTVLAKTRDSAYTYRNFTVGSSASNLGLILSRPFPEDWDGLSFVGNLTVANNGVVTFPGSSDYWRVQALAGGHISVLATGGIGGQEEGYEAEGQWVGGTINLASRQDIVPYGVINTTAFPAAGKPVYHDGSIMMKADGFLQQLAYLGGTSNSPLMGATIRLKSGGNFVNLGTLAANAGSSNASGPSQAGIITISSANDLRIGNINTGGPTMYASGFGNQAGGGFIGLSARTISTPTMDYLQVNGTARNGRISTSGEIRIDPAE